MPDRGPGTGTNYKKRKWNTTFRSEIPAGKTGPPFFLGIFLWDEPTKRVPSTAEPEIPEILTKWKAPYGTGFLLAPWRALVPVALQPGPTVRQNLRVIMETNGVSWIGKQLTVQTQRSHKCIKHSEQFQTFR